MKYALDAERLSNATNSTLVETNGFARVAPGMSKHMGDYRKTEFRLKHQKVFKVLK